MPELPSITLYLSCLRPRVVGQVLRRIRVANPFLLRSVSPTIAEVEGRQVVGLARLGKRVVFALSGDYFAVIHLMIAGRFLWKAPDAKVPGRVGLAAFDFDDGTLILTEAGSKRRASLHLVADEAGLSDHDRGGVDIFACGFDGFREALVGENHTLKRSLTDPRLLSGIGNAYSDEILHRARLSPLRHSSKLSDEELRRLYDATLTVLNEWIERLAAEVGDGFPTKVTAFHPEMAVHGKHGKPCPVCDTPIQRIRYASNETNYCPRCQTEGRLLADRSLSRLLKKDWPRSIDEMD